MQSSCFSLLCSVISHTSPHLAGIDVCSWHCDMACPSDFDFPVLATLFFFCTWIPRLSFFRVPWFRNLCPEYLSLAFAETIDFCKSRKKLGRAHLERECWSSSWASYLSADRGLVNRRWACGLVFLTCSQVISTRLVGWSEECILTGSP